MHLPACRRLSPGSHAAVATMTLPVLMVVPPCMTDLIQANGTGSGADLFVVSIETPENRFDIRPRFGVERTRRLW
ncbi:protein of unknown function [Rhodovastum atsumiense]|nr:protein of unknown function [Rhodovastum atsumiense]